MTKERIRPTGFFAAGCSVALCLAMTTQPAIAQDFTGLFKGLMQGQGRTADTLFSAIKSITEISVGQISPGAQIPQDAQGKVIMYRTAWCGYCKKAAAYMQQKNIPFVERDIEANPAYRAEMTRLGGTGGVPFTVFGNKTQSGFSESTFDQNYAAFRRTLADDNRVVVDAGVAQDRFTPDRTTAPGGLQSGDALVGKIAGIHVYREASKTGPKLLMLGMGDAVIYMGEERDGLYRVTSSRGEGWVDKLLVKRAS